MPYLPGGVIKEVLQEGSGQVPTQGAVVEVHYEGRLFDTGTRCAFRVANVRAWTFVPVAVRRAAWRFRRVAAKQSSRGLDDE